MSISEHFTRDEFACKCGKCGFAAVDVELLETLLTVRKAFNAPVIITSGCRCKRHNKEIGGSPNSMHTKGMAADFRVKGVDQDRVADWLEARFPHDKGIGRYIGRTHIDMRSEKARWDKR